MRKWLPKMPIVHDIEPNLAKLESKLLKASGGAGSSIPSLLNLSTVTASNKF